MNQTSGFLVYDIEADYTLNRIVTLKNSDNDFNEYFIETLPISPTFTLLKTAMRCIRTRMEHPINRIKKSKM